MTESLILKDFASQLEAIPEEFRDCFAPASHFLQEWREYFTALEGVDQIRLNAGVVLSPLVQHGGTSTFRIRIENSLGLSCFQPLVGGRPLGPPFWVEVLSFKFPTPQKHLDFCQTLISELFSRAAKLPFSFSDQTQRGVAESTQPPSPVFTYHFLVHSVETFRGAVEIVQAFPCRRLHDRAHQVPLHEASQVDGDVVSSILQAPETWVASQDFVFAPAMQIEGANYAPQKVWQWLPEETFDTPENRFVLHFLRQVLAALEILPASGWWKSVEGLAEAQALDELAALLRQSLSHSMFDEVGEMLLVPFHSQVLQRQEGYRELLHLWQQFHTARSPLFERWEQAVDLRAVHQLYEMWAFFALIGEVEKQSSLTRLRAHWSDENGIEYGASAEFSDGSILLYNQTFHPNRTTRSYSMELRPDFIWISQGRQVVLDAKFSMQVGEEKLVIAINGEETLVREEHPVRETLYKMHTYRDALVGTHAALVVYPGDRPVFMPTQGKRVYEFTLLDVLNGNARNVPDEIQWNGIGAISLKPGRKH
jgi:predicted component of viral defense system (DUF524 family)